MRAIKEQKEETDNTLSEAFSDLNSLIAKASDMVKIAERLSAKSRQDKDGAQLDAMAQDLGISSPVTKSPPPPSLENGLKTEFSWLHRRMAGSAYHTELSRQLADFLGPLLHRHHGIMLLSDIFCIFNRARGIELVSPDDVVAACDQFESLRLPLRKRTMASGVVVVQSQVFICNVFCQTQCLMQ